MSDNKAVIRRLADGVWNKGDVADLDEVVAPELVDHFAAPGSPPGLEGLKQDSLGFLAAFSDFRTTIDDLVAEGDKVVWRWTVSGRHEGLLMGVRPTGKSITFTGITIFRVANGKIVERWNRGDTMRLIQKLDAIPTPGGS